MSSKSKVNNVSRLCFLGAGMDDVDSSVVDVADRRDVDVDVDVEDVCTVDTRTDGTRTEKASHELKLLVLLSTPSETTRELNKWEKDSCIL